jgi:uncharacterized protein YggU (UPF0235/DUF167 family)
LPAAAPFGWLSAHAAGVRVALKVTPRAAHSTVDGVTLDARGQARLAVRVTAAPDGGKANEAVIRLLAKRGRLPARDLRLISGAGARSKVLQVDGPPQRLLAELATIEQQGDGG